MKSKAMIIEVSAFLLAVLLIVLLNVDCPSHPNRDEQPHSMAGPTPPSQTPIADSAYTARLEAVHQQLGSDFRVRIVKPFVVAGNLPADKFDGLCQRTIDWTVRMLNKDFFSTPVKQIVTIYLFNDSQSYRQYSLSLFGQRPTTPFGYYLPAHRAMVMDISTGTGTLVHEIVHPLLSADFPQAPSWFDEGLASLYEQCHERHGKIVGLLNWRLPVLQKGLQDGHLVPLEELLATSRDEFYADPHGMHYAQARYLCYYLQQKGLLRKFYQQFRADHAADPTGSITLLRITAQESLTQLQSDWLKFLAPLRYEP